MNKAQNPKVQKSKILDKILDEITPREQQRTEKRMLLAARIDDGRIAKGWNQNQFAEAMDKQPSEISKWLSGTHNFTAETLWDIEEKLGIDLILLQEPVPKIIKVMEFKTEISFPAQSREMMAIINKTSTNKKAYTSLDTICYG